MLTRLKPLLCALALVLFFFVSQINALPEKSLRIRQDAGNRPVPIPDSSTVVSSTASSESPGPSATSASQSDRTSSNSRTVTTSDSSSTPTSTGSTVSNSAPTFASTASQPSVTVTSTSTTPTPTPSPQSTAGSEPLPIQPVISPALGIAGVILIITGGSLTFIGVRSKWLFVFESAAFLVALAIVVLLVYVANPPVSNAIQGAYLVAAVVPACILGILALVFKDLVEGLGCLLGGFCLSMWFMTLKANGLISSSGGRIGFIVGLSVASFALSFSHHTRSYGLIACLSFAGATAFILGVDCFSKAGLKEFWIYVWNLNENIFPLGQPGYPLTRSIKVEIACIIILAVFGSMSQMKLWKIIREKRAKRAAARAEDDEAREALETNLGKQLADRNNRELAQWEAAYGDKHSHPNVSEFTSTVDSAQPSPYISRPTSASKVPFYPKDSATELVELNDLVRRSSRDATPITPPEEVHLSTDAAHARPVHTETLRALEPVREQPSPAPSRPMSYVVGSNDDEGHWEQQKPGSPEVTPLPFTVPSGSRQQQHDEDAKSIATAGDDVAEPIDNCPAGNARQSVLRIPNKRTSSTTHSDEGDGFSVSVPHLDDARSSIAATLDGLSEDGQSDLPVLSRSGTPLPHLEADKQDVTVAIRKTHSASSLQDVVPRVEISAPNTEDATRRHSVHLGQLMPESNLGSLSNLPKSQTTSEKASKVAGPNLLSEEGSALNQRISKQATLTKEALPEGQSNTVLLYRTNEWAKHQAVAEALPPEEIAPPSESGVAVAYGSEASAPVDVAALSQNAFHAAPPSISRTPSQATNNNAYKQQARRHSTDSMQDLSRNNSSATINRSSSQTSLHKTMMRSPSNPALSPLSPYSPDTIVESPIEEEAGIHFNHAAAMRSSSTLMGQRQNMLNGRISSMSFATPDAPTHSTAGLVYTSGQPAHKSDSTSSSGAGHSSRRRQSVNEEDLTLAQRKAVLKQQGRMQRSTSALSSANPYRNHTPSPASLQRAVSQQHLHSQISTANARVIYDSHQPQRGNTISHATRETRLASWRASVSQDPAVNGMHGNNINNSSRTSLMDDSRARIIDEQRRAGEARAAKKMEDQRRNSQIDQRMRQGDMVALHREHLRKLQRQASQTQ